MTKEVSYLYIGTNGTILSPVHLEDVYYIRKNRLSADPGKKLTKDGKNFSTYVVVSDDEVNDWYEV